MRNLKHNLRRCATANYKLQQILHHTRTIKEWTLVQIDIVITTLSCYTPTPSLGAFLINRFGFKTGVLAYSLGGMGCSASVVAVDMAKHILKSNPNKLALLVCHENVSNNT